MIVSGLLSTKDKQIDIVSTHWNEITGYESDKNCFCPSKPDIQPSPTYRTKVGGI